MTQACGQEVVGALIYDQEGRLGMFFRNTFPSNVIACPVGHIDEGMSAEDTLDKEVLEEIGLVVTKKRLVLKTHLPYICRRQKFYEQNLGHTWHVFLAEVKDYEVKTNDREVVPGTFHWYTPGELQVVANMWIEPAWLDILAHPAVNWGACRQMI